MSLLDELLVGLGFEYDPKDLEEFEEGLSKTGDMVKKLSAVTVAAISSINAFVFASTKSTDAQGKLAKEIGETVESVDALQFAMIRSGGTAEGMVSSLRNLSIRASEAARGVGSGVEAFGMLGIQLSDADGKLKSTSSLMSEISDKLQGLSSSRQIELAEKLGVRESIRLLQSGSNSIKELTQEAIALGVATEKDAKAAADFQDSFTNIWQIIKQVSRTISTTLAPAMTNIADTITEWWKANRKIIEQKLPEWVDKFTTALKLAFIAVSAFIAVNLAVKIIALVSAFKALSASALFANASIMLMPILIGSALAALALLVQDAKTFFNGGESFLGDMLEKFPKWKDEIIAVTSALAVVSDITNMIWDGWKEIFSLFEKFSLDNVKEVAKNLPGFIGDVTNLKTVEGGGLIPKISEGISSASEKVSNTTSNFIDKLEIVVQGGADTAENIAEKVMSLFQQTSEDLNSAVDQ